MLHVTEFGVQKHLRLSPMHNHFMIIFFVFIRANLCLLLKWYCVISRM